MNIFIQAASHHIATPANPLGLGYRIQLAGDYRPIADHLGDRVAGRRVLWHLPLGYPKMPNKQEIMPFDEWFWARTLWPAFTSRMEDTFIDACRQMRDRGAEEVIAYMGSLPSCNRVTANLTAPGRLDDVSRIIHECTRVPLQAGCSIAYDATGELPAPEKDPVTGEVRRNWIIDYLTMQQAILAEQNLKVYVEATPSFKSGVFDKFPSFVLDSTFTKRHIQGQPNFPTVDSKQWYTQPVNVLTTDYYFRNQTDQEIRDTVDHWKSFGVSTFANVGLIDRMIPRKTTSMMRAEIGFDCPWTGEQWEAVAT